MNIDHYAIVIGLSIYQNLGTPPPQNLQGPENDADDVLAWLTDPNGGGLLPENVQCIRSRDCSSPPVAAPTRDDISAAFLWLDQIAELNKRNGKGRTVGSRIYVYVSGHGFSPRARQGCLLAGNAAERQFGANVFPTAWIEWLQDADYFRECVLWMDCCMDRIVLTPPTPPPLDPILASAPAGPSFIAFAAQRPLKAVEKQIPEDGNRWHGIFTWNLLQGLRGAAANEFGVVTGKSLADWLRHAQWAWLSSAERINPDIAKVPAIIEDDDRLVFARGIEPPLMKVTLRIPAATEAETARLWFGRPPRPGPRFNITPTGTTLSLRPGLYLADVSDTGLRQGFVVTRSDEIALTDEGEVPSDLADAPAGTGRTFNLSVNPGDPTATIRIIGDGFRSVDAAAGQLISKVPFGLYEMRIHIGRQLAQKVLLVDADWPKAVPATSADHVPALPLITSAAPLANTRAASESQELAVATPSQQPDLSVGSGGVLLIMARGLCQSGQADPTAQPWEGVVLLDESRVVIADLSLVGRRELGPDPYALCTIGVPPGAYVLEYPLAPGTKAAQSLIVPPGNWRLEAYLMRNLDAPAERPRVSLLMRRVGSVWGTSEDIQLEKARVALADERPILSDELSELLLMKFQNPLAGIIGGHLLLIEQEQGGRDRRQLLNIVVPNLRTLVGVNHPDVEALSLACPDPRLRATSPVEKVPMLERSWRFLVKASRDSSQLLPLPLWQRVFAVMSIPPFLVWSPDHHVREEVMRQLATAAFAQDDSAARGAGHPTYELASARIEPGAIRPVRYGWGTAKSAIRWLGSAVPQIFSPSAPVVPGPIQSLSAEPASVRQDTPHLRPRIADALDIPPVAAASLWQEFRSNR